MKLFGLEAFSEALEEKLELADWITNQLRQIPEVEIVTEPRLSLVSFRLRDDPDGEATHRRCRQSMRGRTFILRVPWSMADSPSGYVCCHSVRTATGWSFVPATFETRYSRSPHPADTGLSGKQYDLVPACLTSRKTTIRFDTFRQR